MPALRHIADLKSETTPGPKSTCHGKRVNRPKSLPSHRARRARRFSVGDKGNGAIDIQFESIAPLVVAKIVSHAHARFWHQRAYVLGKFSSTPTPSGS